MAVKTVPPPRTGLPRSFSGNVYHKHYEFPIIGNISMDLCTIDITSHGKLQIGDWVEIFGNSVKKYLVLFMTEQQALNPLMIQ